MFRKMKPAQIVNIGITGMRHLPVEGEKAICGALFSVLRCIREQWWRLTCGDCGQTRLLSALAEGVDSLAAETALALGYQLQCPLPMPRGMYLQTFDHEANKQNLFCLLDRAAAVFEPDVEGVSSSEAYELASEILLDHCDVLIAVWNNVVTNRVAGTYPTLRSAMRSGIPVILVSVGEVTRISFCYRGCMSDDWEGALCRVLLFLRGTHRVPQHPEMQTEILHLLHPVGYAHRYCAGVDMLAANAVSEGGAMRAYRSEDGLPNIRLTGVAMRRFAEHVLDVCSADTTAVHRLLAARVAAMLAAGVADDTPAPAGIGITLSSLRDMCLAADAALSFQ